MIIFGIHNTGITSSAAAVVDGVLTYACAEERLDRKKYSKYFPHLSIEAALEYIGATIDDIDVFAVGWNPAINIAERYRAGFSEWPGYPGARFYSNANQILPRLKPAPLTATDQIFHRSAGKATKLSHVTHHLAHAATAYYASGFDEAAIFTCDSYGERTTTAWFHARNGTLNLLREIKFPHSIGQLYSAFTQFLGFRPYFDEWKVMGASAYGDASVFREQMSRMFRTNEEAEIELNLSYFQHFDFDATPMFTPLLEKVFGPARKSDMPMQQQHFHLAAALQETTEAYLFKAVKWLKSQTDCPNLCLSGGVIMNSLFNGRVATEGPFQNVYIPFAPDDSGNSIGAALWVAAREGETISAKAAANPLLGREYTDDEIYKQIQASNISAERPANIVAETANLLAEGNIVGWFQGRMEFGQRALGARSILADPRGPKTKERINNAIKFREPFRPFAPAILAESVNEWFETEGPVDVPYMEKVLFIKKSKQSLIPAVTHIDGSGRLQTVHPETNNKFYDLIKAFEETSGIPMVLNTSFNMNNEPIVESPLDAIRTFYSSGLDALVIGSFVLKK